MSNIHTTQCKNKKVSPFQTYYYHEMDGDLWAEIFKRLAIKSLSRFRCVCKSWNSLISSALFINLHLSFNSSTIPLNLKTYLHVANRRFRYVRLNNLATLSHKCYTLCRPLDDVEHMEQQLYFPFREDREYGIKSFTFVDLIHGVVCISYSWFASHAMPPNPCFNSTYLWNPAIHKYFALPCLQLPCLHHAIGFGYNSSRNDFKVILILIQSRTYQVYSTRQGLWKTSAADGIKLEWYWEFIGNDRPTFVNGTIHWSLKSRKPTIDSGLYSVLMFDCESEEFRRIKIPEKIYAGMGVPIELFEYAGMLGALFCNGSIMDLCTDVWVMEEHGVSTSWKKLYVLRRYDAIRCDPSFEKLSPYGPNNRWKKITRGFSIYDGCIDRVYDETMFLMDHPEAQSYTNKEIVTMSTADPY